MIRKVSKQKRIGLNGKASFSATVVYGVYSTLKTIHLLVVLTAKSEDIIKEDHIGRKRKHFSVMKTIKRINRKFYLVGYPISVVA